MSIHALLETEPHYTNLKFSGSEPVTVYGQFSKDLDYSYSDRIQFWDYEKHERATALADESEFRRKTCGWYQVWLSHCFGREVEIFHILVHINPSTGYPYQLFGYKDKQVEIQ